MASREAYSLLQSLTNEMRSYNPPLLQVVNLIKSCSLKLNKLLCLVSLMLTFRLTWVRPLSEDT